MNAKTPREILLEKAKTALPKMDAVRRAAIAVGLKQSVQTVRKSPDQNCETTFFQRLVIEWIIPFRAAWAGMVAVWIGILTLTILTQTENQPTVSVANKTSNPQVIMALGDTRKVIADLVMQPERSHAKTPISKPRTQLWIRDEEIHC